MTKKPATRKTHTQTPKGGRHSVLWPREALDSDRTEKHRGLGSKAMTAVRSTSQVLDTALKRLADK
jgi:hypothetical protein